MQPGACLDRGGRRDILVTTHREKLAASDSSPSPFEAVNETPFLTFPFPRLLLLSNRPADHLPSIPAREVCPVGPELHHVQWRGRVRVPEQPVPMPVC